MIGVPQFDFSIYPDGGGHEWQQWLRSFEWYLQANKIEDEHEKFVNLMHLAGQKVQELYATLPVPEDVASVPRGPLRSGYIPHLSEYKMAVAKLNDHFQPKKNSTYERHELRRLKQEEGENIALFAMRLRKQAERCDFGDKFEEHVKDQLIEKCESQTLRRKLLALGDANLDAVLRAAKAFEAVQEQSKALNEQKGDQAIGLNVNKIDIKARQSFNSNNNSNDKSIECHRCGYTGHRQFDEKCPAKGKTCNKCGGKDHFGRKCRTKKRPRSAIENTPQTGQIPEKRPTIKMETEIQEAKSKSNESVKFVQPTTQKEYIFHITTASGHPVNELGLMIGGVKITVVIDSGTKHNIIDFRAWEYLKANKVRVTNQRTETDKNFTAYGDHPLSFVGIFEAEIRTTQKKKTADFYVFKDYGKILIGYDTATALGVLKIGENVNQIEMNERIGKMKGIVVNIPIDESVKPVAQPYRRMPVALEEIVNKKIDELLEMGIIEKVNGPSNWISGLVAAPKANDVRVCVDMRRANEAVKRENYPLPTIEDFLPHLGKGKMFTKLDIKNAFHQVTHDLI